jgi:hypothetical protein
MADAYLPHTVHDLPIPFAFEDSGRLRASFEHYQRQGVIRVIAGAEACHVVVDVRRPYSRPCRTVAWDQSLIQRPEGV